MAECRYVELGGHLCLLADKGSVVEKIDNSEEEMVDKVGSDVQSVKCGVDPRPWSGW